MIISIRGPSGAGKSHLVTRLAADLGPGEPEFCTDHPLPVGTFYSGCFILGRYDVRASGADSVPLRNWPRDRVFGIIREAAAVVPVIFEGMAISNEVMRTAALPECVVIALTTSVEECLASAAARRDRPHVHPGAGIAARAHELENTYRRLVGMGVRVEHFSREVAYQFVSAALGL